jgi:hypothetical protein
LETIAFLDTPARRTCRRLTTPACSAMTRRRPGGIVFAMRPSIRAWADIRPLAVFAYDKGMCGNWASRVSSARPWLD